MDSDKSTDKVSESEIIARYLRKGVIWQMPAKPTQRELVLKWLVKRIPLGQTFSETEINAYLGGHNVDHVTLRRYLVDHQLLERDRTQYWRTAPAEKTGS
jgi:hypothetical protein